MEQPYRRDRTVSAFAAPSSTNRPVRTTNDLPPLPPKSHGPVSSGQPAAAFRPQPSQKPRQRVKSDSNARTRPTSAHFATSPAYNVRDARSAGGHKLRMAPSTATLEQAQLQHQKSRLRGRTNSHETSQGFVSLNSILDTVGLPRPPEQQDASYMIGPQRLNSSWNQKPPPQPDRQPSFQQPGASRLPRSVPESLLEPPNLDPGFSISKPPDPPRSQSGYNPRSVQTLASSLNHGGLSSSSNPNEPNGNDPSSTLTQEQCWYLLRTLVELEIEDECTKLWRLTGGLNAESVEWDSAMDFASSEEAPASTEEMYAEDQRLRDVPVLRYLLRILFDLPLVREAGHDTAYSTAEADRRPLVSGMNLFWHAGLSPLLRSLHEMDLSQPMDRGRSNFFSHLFDAFTRAMARFVSAGLNFTDQELPTEPTGQSTTLVEDLAKSERSGYLSDISESPASPAFSRLFFGGPDDPNSPQSLAQQLADADNPVTSHPAQGKLSTLYSGGSDIQSQRVSYNESNDTPSASPVKTMPSLAERFRQGESAALQPTAEEAREEERKEELHSPKSETTALAEEHDDRRLSRASASTEMFTCEEGPRTSVDVESQFPAGPLNRHSGSTDEDAGATYNRRNNPHSMQFTPPHSPFLSDSNPPIAWPTANLDPPYYEPQEMTPGRSPRRSPSPLLLQPAPMAKALSSSLPASPVSSPGPTSSTLSLSPTSPTSPSQQSTIKKGAPRKRRFTLSFSRKKVPKDLKADISSPILVHEPQSPLHVTEQTPTSATRRFFIDGEEVADAWPMEAQQAKDAASAIPQDRQAIKPQLTIIHKGGHPFHWTQSYVPHQPAIKAVSWGGFSVDVVGARESLFGGRSFILRIRRPSRLDEYILRSRADFEALRTKLVKVFSQAYVRSLPSSKAAKAAASVDSRAEPEVKEQSADKRDRRQSMSRFSARLREAAIRDKRAPQLDVPESSSVKRSSRRGTLSTLRSASSADLGGPTLAFLDGKPVPIPKYDGQRRALRSWLADTLTIRGLPHDVAVTTFLLSNPQTLSEMDLRSMRQCQAIDETRRLDRRQRAGDSSEQCKLMHLLWSGLSYEAVNDNGLDAFSDALRNNETLAQCPLRMQKSAEWLTSVLAQFLYDTLVATESDSFSRLKSYLSTIPWFLLKTTFRLSSKKGMFRKALSDLFLARPYGSNGSLLERLLAVFLDDDESTAEQLAACRARIGSIAICEKLRQYVASERDVKQTVRRHAQFYDIPLVVAIARGGDLPTLDQFDLERVIRASRHWERLTKSSQNPPTGQTMKHDAHIRLIVDMQLYLRLLSQMRDGQQIRGALQDGVLTEPLLVLLGPVVDLCARLNHENNLVDFVGYLQRFSEQLVAVVTAARSRIQEPHAGIRMLAKLITKYQEPFYTFLHRAHLSDPIIDDILAWLSSMLEQLKPSEAAKNTIYLASILPSSEESLRAFAQELDELVQFHRRKRDLAQERVFRQTAGDYEADDPITVQGDGYGRSRTEPIVEQQPAKPYIGQIAQCLTRFRASIAGLFDKESVEPRSNQ